MHRNYCEPPPQGYKFFKRYEYFSTPNNSKVRIFCHILVTLKVRLFLPYPGGKFEAYQLYILAWIMIEDLRVDQKTVQSFVCHARFSAMPHTFIVIIIPATTPVFRCVIYFCLDNINSSLLVLFSVQGRSWITKLGAK